MVEAAAQAEVLVGALVLQVARVRLARVTTAEIAAATTLGVAEVLAVREATLVHLLLVVVAQAQQSLVLPTRLALLAC